ncbi:MAG: hypothetical protein EOO10_20640, partial [Chitinophagaceae bacterium]
MPLRKRNLKASPPQHKKGRPVGQKTKSIETVGNGESIIIDAWRGKNYKWAIEGIKREFQHMRNSPMPGNLKPTLASIVDEPFNDEDWQFEIKWDGYRSIAYINNGTADLFSRNNLSFNHKYQSIVEALKAWPVNAVVDGEIVVLSENGKADFSALQQWDKKRTGEILYFVFDIIWAEGIDLRKEPLTARREVLRKLMPEN